MIRNDHKLDFIKNYIEEKWQIKLDKRCRSFEYIGARWAYYYTARNLTPCSYAVIGDKLGRDHATVLHALKQIPLPEWVDLKNDTYDFCKEVFTENYNSKEATHKVPLVNRLINLKEELQRLKEEKTTNEKLDLECNLLLDYFNKLNRQRKMQLLQNAQTALKVQEKFKVA